MAKKIDYTVNFEKENGNVAIAEILMNGKVDVTIKTPNNATIIRHFDNTDDMKNEMKAMGYSAV